MSQDKFGIKIILEKYDNTIIYKCSRCYRELLIKTDNYFAFTNNCDHYKVYTLHLYDSIDCQKDKIEVRYLDNNGWMYVICKR